MLGKPLHRPSAGVPPFVFQHAWPGPLVTLSVTLQSSRPAPLRMLQAQLRRALMDISTRRRLALTGYPLQNNMTEMWVSLAPALPPACAGSFSCEVVVQTAWSQKLTCQCVACDFYYGNRPVPGTWRLALAAAAGRPLPGCSYNGRAEACCMCSCPASAAAQVPHDHMVLP